jgi:HK97 family phage major capsid protein
MVATAIRTNAELEAILKSPDQMAAYIGEVAKNTMGDVAEGVISGAVQRAMAKSKLPTRPSMTSAIEGDVMWMRGEVYQKARKAGFSPDRQVLEIMSGDSRGDFESMREYTEAIYSTKNGGGHPKLKAALAEAAGALGGFLVPEEYRMELRMLQLEQSHFRGTAVVIPMGSMVQHWPYVRDVSHATSVYGGVIGYWESEAATIGESEPAFGQLTLTAKKLTAYTVISNEVMQDSSGALESFIGQQFPDALNFFEEKALWKGIGTGQPLGVLSSDNGALLSVTRDVTGHVTYTDLSNMASHILPSSENNVVWFANPSVKTDLYQMSLNVGTGGSAVFVNPLTGGATQTPPNTIFGRPLIFTEHLKALGTAGDIVAVDLSYYLIGDRQAMAMMASPHVKFTQDQTVFRLIQRLDGRPWLDSSLTLEDGSTVVSPFVALTT